MALLVPLACATALGVWLAGVLPPPWPLALGGAGVAFSWRHRARALALPCALWLAVGAARMAAWHAHPEMALAHALPDQPASVTLQVRVERELAEATEFGGPVYRIQTRYQRMEGGWAARPGRARLITHRANRAVREGDELLLEGQWARVPPPTNPGEPDRRARFARERIFGEVRLRAYDPIVALPRAPGAWRAGIDASAWLAPLRTRWQRLIEDALPARSAGLVRSMVLGQRVALEPSIREAFVQTGTMHLLVISGGNVALIAWLVFGGLCVTGLPWRARLALCAALLGGYALMTGADPPVVRATLMAWALLWSRLADRPLPWALALALAGLAMLLAHPTSLWDPSVQLSFGAVAALIVLATGWCRALEARLACMPRWIGRPLAAGIGSTSAVSLGLLPIFAWYFHQVTPVGLLANLLAAPCIALIALVGTAGLLLGTCWDAAWHAVAAPLHALVELTVLVVRGCQAIPGGSWAVPRPPLAVVWGYYAAWMAGAWLARRGVPARRLAGWGASALLLASAGAWWCRQVWPRPLELQILDVGHGDAIMLRTPRGRVWMVDAGHEAMGRSRVLPVLRAAGISRLNALVLTHPDADHLGGAIPLLQQVKIDRVLTNEVWDGTMSARAVRRLARDRGVPVVTLAAGEALTVEPGVMVRVLHPPELSVMGAQFSDNDASLVLQVAYGQARFLLTGDVEERGMPALIGQPALESWVLQMPHHGSALGRSGEMLVQAARPSLAVISAGQRYGLPSPETLALLRERRIPAFTTREHGAIRITTDGSHMMLTTWRTGLRIACRPSPGDGGALACTGAGAKR